MAYCQTFNKGLDILASKNLSQLMQSFLSWVTLFVLRLTG